MNAAGLVLSIFASVVVAACTAEKQVRTPKPLRVGHTYVNGNCALDSENKLTGLCEGSGKSGCLTHEPDPESPSCTAGLAVTETRAPACSTSASSEVVSREHVCFFVNRADR